VLVTAGVALVDAGLVTDLVGGLAVLLVGWLNRRQAGVTASGRG
jgi:hypothetical protein